MKKRVALVSVLLLLTTLAFLGCGGPATVSVGVGVAAPGGWVGATPYGPGMHGGVWVGMPPGGYVYY
jgi:hypothetical protein